MKVSRRDALKGMAALLLGGTAATSTGSEPTGERGDEGDMMIPDEFPDRIVRTPVVEHVPLDELPVGKVGEVFFRTVNGPWRSLGVVKGWRIEAWPNDWLAIHGRWERTSTATITLETAMLHQERKSNERKA